VKANPLDVSGDNLHIEYLDGKYEEYDELNDIFWLEPIDVVATDERTAEQVGCCMASLVRRQKIRHLFHKNMIIPFNDLAMLAFDLFDRYGRLKDDYKHHPIRKGSGFWKDQLDRGDMLVIEDVTIDQQYRRRGIGTRLVQALLGAASKKVRGGKFVALTWPDPSKGDHFHQTMENLVGYVNSHFIERKDTQAIKWLRSVGFRRIGSSIWFGAIVGHGAQPGLPTIADDYDPPLISRPNNLVPESILHAFKTSKDKPRLKALQKHVGPAEPDDERWLATDEAGNTLMHLAALFYAPDCLVWIMGQPGGRRLQNTRNHNHDTPLEALELNLDKYRTRLFTGRFLLPWSDGFHGYPKKAVRCLVALKGVHLQPQDPGWKRLAGGCTCGECFEGCMSPRMRLALATQAEGLHESYTEQLTDMGPRQWVSCNVEEALPFYCFSMMNHSRSMCLGFTSLMKHISKCLWAGMLPNEVNIMSIHDRDEKDKVNTKNFFKGGGKVATVAKVAFEAAIDDDSFTDVGTPAWPLPEGTNELPKCRNDHEYGYVGIKCRYAAIEPFVGFNGDLEAARYAGLDS
jgi:GNAT superfamily N-acetyltransferase